MATIKTNGLLAAVFLATTLNVTTSSTSFANSRLYRHCHIVGSRGFTKCMTADPWSPEHMELDRRAGRFNHEGGPNDPRTPRNSLTLRTSYHCHAAGHISYCFERDPRPQDAKIHPFDCPVQSIHRSFHSHITLTCPSI